MKRNILDKAIGFFSPSAELRRLQSRARAEATLRAYDIAKNFSTSDWTSATNGSANAETKAAIGPGRMKARSLTQNAPYGVAAVNVIVTEVVGAGIVPKITGKNKTVTKKLNDLWKEIAETSKVDSENRNNFYGLQALAVRSMVESGEGLGLLRLNVNAPQIQLLESDFIVTEKDEGNIVQGVERDASGARVSYHLFKSHPGDRLATTETVQVPASDVVHVYRQDRPGQVRGVTWAHAVVEKMNDFNDYQHATLVRQKIAACFAGFITTSGTDSLLDAAALKARRESEFSLEPATVRYLNAGEDVKLANPPGVEGYAEFNRETLRGVAAGWGISYEAMTGDYSQSNYSSSRLGQTKMRKNVEFWQWNIVIPQFCEPYFQRFLLWAKLRHGIDITGATAEWVPPASTQIDPAKEISADKEAVKAGFKSRAQVIREAGRDPDVVLEEIRNERELAKQLGVSFDTDTNSPSANTQGVINSEENSQKDAAEQSDQSGG